jgi:hypothetical protein
MPVCCNGRCLETFEGDWRFCPSCQLAIAIGFKYGALAVGVVAAIAGYLVGLWQ